MTLSAEAQGQLAFAPAFHEPFGATPTSVAVGDFNEDGHQDLVSADANDGLLTIFLGNGRGGLQRSRWLSTGLGELSFPEAVRAADFNRDGHLDLIVANFGYRLGSTLLCDFVVFLGNGRGDFAGNKPIQAGKNPTDLLVADFNGDGAPDFAAVNYGDASVEVHLGDGRGGFPTMSAHTLSGHLSSVAAADLDHDGRLDLVVANTSGGSLQILRGDGLGSFAAPRTLSTGTNPYSVIAVDATGDGNIDLLTADAWGGSSVSLFPGDGMGGFGPPRGFHTGLNPSDVLLADFDGDGIDDIAAPSYSDRNVSILLGLGGGEFAGAFITPLGYSLLEAVVADLDGDTKPDLAVADFWGSGVWVLLNVSTFRPTLGSAAVSDITDTSVRAGAEVIAQGESPIVDRGFVYAPEAVSSDPRLGDEGVTRVSVQGSLGSFDRLLSGLSIGTTYVLRGFATSNSGTSYTGVARFSTTSPAKVTVADVSRSEGYSSGSMVFVVRLSTTLAFDSSLRYSTFNGSATAGSDYTAVSGTLHFAAGEEVKHIIVPVSGDSAVEPNETFSVILSHASGISLQGAPPTGTILNDDGPTISVTDVAVAEQTGPGTTYLEFMVMTSQTSSSVITVTYATSDGTATAGSDYTAVSGTAWIEPGMASVKIKVPVTRDALIESNETLFLRLTGASRATIADGMGVGTIIADDGLLVSIGDKTTKEGDIGTTAVTLPVTLSQASADTVTVAWATTNGTATAPLDYQSESGTVTLNPGQTTATITVQIAGDTLKEPYESFFVNLSNPTGGATIGDGQGQVTISNTDGSTDRSRLLFHNFVTNRLFRWHMKDGNTLDTYNWVTPWSTDPGWTVGAVADFDQDGHLDYLWHNTDDGRMLFWYIDGDNLKGYQFLPYLMGPPWTVATTFDANNDGAVDIVYYNSTTGAVRVVLHDNASLLSQYDLSQSLPGAEPLRVVNAVDANNDGDDELVLYNSATGQVSAWDVNGATVGSTIAYANTQTTTETFTLVSTKTDFNDDGLPDFLWHHRPTGMFSVWFMNGTTRLDVGVFQPFTATDPAWRVVGSANLW